MLKAEQRTPAPLGQLSGALGALHTRKQRNLLPWTTKRRTQLRVVVPESGGCRIIWRNQMGRRTTIALFALALSALSTRPAAATVMDGSFVGIIRNGSDVGDFGGTLQNPVSHDGEVVTGSFTFDTGNLPSNSCSNAVVFCQAGPTFSAWEKGTITLNGYTVGFFQTGLFGGVYEFAGQHTRYSPGGGDFWDLRQNPGEYVNLSFNSLNSNPFIFSLDPPQGFIASGKNTGDSDFYFRGSSGESRLNSQRAAFCPALCPASTETVKLCAPARGWPSQARPRRLSVSSVWV